jgi:competence protein ComEC
MVAGLLALIFFVRYQGVGEQTTSGIVVNPAGGIRVMMQKNLIRWLPGDTGPLASGILLGGNEGLSKKAKQAFIRSGIMHITAASGYNVTVVAGWMMALGIRFTGRRKAIWLGVVGTFIYMYLAGLSTAVIRAGVMAVLTLLASFWGRKADAGWTLILTSGLMLCVNPGWIADIGFQLSVAATAGLVWINTVPGKSLLSDFKTTVVAQITTMPLILHHFGSLSVVSPMVNGAVLWAVPPVMQISALASVAGIIWEPAGGILALLAWPLLTFMVRVVEWSASWPGASLSLSRLGWGWVGVYYLVIFLVVKISNKKTGKSWEV